MQLRKSSWQLASLASDNQIGNSLPRPKPRLGSVGQIGTLCRWVQRAMCPCTWHRLMTCSPLDRTWCSCENNVLLSYVTCRMNCCVSVSPSCCHASSVVGVASFQQAYIEHLLPLPRRLFFCGRAGDTATRRGPLVAAVMWWKLKKSPNLVFLHAARASRGIWASTKKQRHSQPPPCCRTCLVS